MQLNLTTTYAIRCMTCLAEHEEGISSRMIGEEISVDREFTLKILRMLRKAGLVKSTKGSAGGYQLVRPADETPLWKIIEVTEDSMRISRVSEAECKNRIAAHRAEREHGLYRYLQRHIDKLFYNISLQDIIDQEYAEMQYLKVENA